MACLTEMKIHKPTIDVDNSDKADLAAAYDTCHEQYLACMLLRGACQARYSQLKNDLANNMTEGSDNYPKSIVDTTRMINKYKGAIRVHRIRDGDGDGVAFVQGGSLGRRKPKEVKEAQDADTSPNCWHCGKPGHHKNRCPDLAIKGIDNLNVAEWDDTHALFSTSGDAQEWGDGEAQECIGVHTCPTGDKDEGHLRCATTKPPVHQHVSKLRQHTIPQPPHERLRGGMGARGPQQLRVGHDD
jgi:hypothetical protein